MSERVERPPFPQRTWILMGLGLLTGLAIHFLTKDVTFKEEHPLRLAIATGLGTAGMALALTLERERWTWAAGFAATVGLVIASVLYWNGGPGTWYAAEGWRLFCAALAMGVAAPLFQAARDEGRLHFPYPAVHAYSWANIILDLAAIFFVGLLWLLAWLLASLFELIGIHLLTRLLEHGWFHWMLFGGSFGGFIGLLRTQERIVGLVQRVVLALLAVLAPLLALGLAGFLVSLPFTGLEPLWQATKSTTPILLGCCLVAVLLANCVIGDTGDETQRSRVLRIGAMILAFVILPFAVIAAVSTGLRIGQYGLTPSRLWAIVFTLVANAWGVAYWIALARRRDDWAEAARPANLTLALCLCGLAFLLSTPLVSFSAIATRSQVARLEQGRVTPDAFDWAALAFDFGPPGKAALARLRRSSDPRIAALATETASKGNRYDVASVADRKEAAHVSAAAVSAAIVVRPVQVDVPLDLRRAIFGAGIERNLYVVENNSCKVDSRAPCLLFWEPGDDVAVIVQDDCLVPAAGKPTDPPTRCDARLATLRLRDGKWGVAANQGLCCEGETPDARAALAAKRRAIGSGDVAVREVRRRQLFIGGKPVGDPFE